MFQLDQQARPNECGAGDKMRQTQGQELVDRAEPEMGDDPPSWSLVVQGGSTGPGVVAGEPQSARPSLSGTADDTIESTIHL